jgi:hypothetical protein
LALGDKANRQFADCGCPLASEQRTREELNKNWSELADWIAAYDRAEIFQAVCKLGLEGIVSKKLDTPYKSGTSKAWLKIKNPNASAAICSVDGTF